MSRLARILSDDDYLDPDERERRAIQKERELVQRRLTPDWFTRQRDLCIPSGLKVAVIGGGFAGLAAAWYLKACGMTPVVFEAADRVGGRVWSDRSFIPGKVVEAGAELIGENHPLWRILARAAGLPLVALTEDEEYERAGLRVRVRYGMHDLTPAEKSQLAAGLRAPLATIGAEALGIDQERPWITRTAGRFDSISVDDRLSQLIGRTSSLVRSWFEFTLGNDNCAPITAQSYLGLLSSVSAARMGSDAPGMLGYWMSTETHRCRGGNDLLSDRLGRLLRSDLRLRTTVEAVTVQPDGYWPPVVVQSARRGASGAVVERRSDGFHYAVLAAPPTVWRSIRFSPTFPASARTIQHGPAIKYLTRSPTAFWIAAGLAPNTRWDQLGSVWESTDKQGTAPGFGLSVFSGGPFVQPAASYGPKLTQLYPTRPVSAAPPSDRMVDWPTTPNILTGYAVPGVGQASTIHPAQWRPHQGRLYFAGEQTSPGFFGYMEGALQSGARAARDLVTVLARPCQPPTRIAGAPEPNDGGLPPGGLGGASDSGFEGGVGGGSGGGGSSGDF